MAMALKLCAWLALLALLPSSIAASSSPFTSSIASTFLRPSYSLPSSIRVRHGRLRRISSFLEGQLKVRNRLMFSSEVRLAAVTANASSSSSSTTEKLPAEPEKQKQTNEKSPAVKWLTGVALGTITGGLSALITSQLYRSVRRFAKGSQAVKPIVFQRKFIDANAIAFFKKADAVENLELLGRGGSSAVFKATLANGIVVAIKRMLRLAGTEDVDFLLEKSYDLTKNSAQILAEVNTLSYIRHLNLVTLLAYIPQPRVHLLIYEYMEHGSLRDVMNKVVAKELELPWAKRLAIAKDVATGLKYLHFECNPAIIHRDLKPGNILLDRNMVAHIGDFGLAKKIPDEHTHITSHNVAGTLGYIAPEHYQSLRYTAKGDIYAFGIVLIVLITGKEPANNFFADIKTTLGNWLSDVFRSGEESVNEIVDPSLQGHGDEQEIILTLKVAAFCLLQNPSERPDADVVLKMLSQIKQPQQAPLPSVELLIKAE